MPTSEAPGSDKWGVGVELDDEHCGPLRFAAALNAATARPDAPHDLFVGVHIVPPSELFHPLIGAEEAEQIQAKAAHHVEMILKSQGLVGERVRVEIVEDEDVELGLAEASARLGVDALIIGRRAKRNEDPIVRLGEVTRRLLRRLPVAIVVVPPDFGVGDDPGLGAGPVIVGADLSEHCVDAVKFAAEVAARLDRELVLAHGTQAFHWGVSYIPEASLEQIQRQTRETAGRELEAWARELGVSGRSHVFMGDPAKRLLELAHNSDATLLVTGSRKLGPVERLFLSSVSSELAAAADCPVAVVPSS